MNELFKALAILNNRMGGQRRCEHCASLLNKIPDWDKANFPTDEYYACFCPEAQADEWLRWHAEPTTAEDLGYPEFDPKVARCACGEKLTPCPARADGEDTYVGFYPCPKCGAHESQCR